MDIYTSVYVGRLRPILLQICFAFVELRRVILVYLFIVFSFKGLIVPPYLECFLLCVCYYLSQDGVVQEKDKKKIASLIFFSEFVCLIIHLRRRNEIKLSSYTKKDVKEKISAFIMQIKKGVCKYIFIRKTFYPIGNASKIDS